MKNWYWLCAILGVVLILFDMLIGGDRIITSTNGILLGVYATLMDLRQKVIEGQKAKK